MTTPLRTSHPIVPNFGFFFSCNSRRLRLQSPPVLLAIPRLRRWDCLRVLARHWAILHRRLRSCGFAPVDSDYARTGGDWSLDWDDSLLSSAKAFRLWDLIGGGSLLLAAAAASAVSSMLFIVVACVNLKWIDSFKSPGLQVFL